MNIAPADDDAPVHVLLVEDEPDLRSTLRYNLKRAGYAVTEVGDGAAALAALRAATGGGVEVIVSDVMMPGVDGHALVKAVRADAATAELPFLFLTAKGEAADRVEGFRLGADDYLAKPFDVEELLARVQVQARRAVTTRRLRALLRSSAPVVDERAVERSKDLYAKVAAWEQRFPALAALRRGTIVGGSPATLLLLREILLRAPGRDPVLVIGETGTGKTGVAAALHQLGPRAQRPFRVVSCAELGAADVAIVGGKLFGYGRGSGLPHVSKDGQPGLLEECDGGTLFFDEIHRLPLTAQGLLLLPLEGRPFSPAVGTGEPRTVDVRFVFATNVDLQAEAQAGRFPFDLYQRLASSQIRVPPLRERTADVAALAVHFLEECRAELAVPDATFAPRLLRHLIARAYPGNIRELRHLVREIARRAAFELDTVLTLEHLPDGPPVVDAPVAIPHIVTDDPAHDDDGGVWNDEELRELLALRRHRFRIGPAERELALSSKSRTLTNHLRGLCFKALTRTATAAGWDVAAAAALVVGRPDEALIDRTVERMQSYLDMVEQHVDAHTVDTLFNNLPRDYRKHVEQAIERARARRG